MDKEVVLGAPDRVNIPRLMHDTPSANKMLYLTYTSQDQTPQTQ